MWPRVVLEQHALGRRRASLFGSSSSSKTRSAEAAVLCSTFMMLAIWVIGIVNWREYWMKAWTSPSEMRPVATMRPPTTAMAT